jgi:small GTP-binding protein
MDYDYLLKYIIIGDAAVGKSNLLIRYSQGEFNEEYRITIGVEFGVKTEDIDGKKFRIQIWDTAGQENFRSIVKGYYQNSACAIVTYDITSRKSFSNVKSWIEECKNLSSKNVLIVLVGNKTDLSNQREVETDEGRELADQNGILFFETSAKTGENVDEVFKQSVIKISKRLDEGFYNLDDDDDCGIKQGNNKSKDSKALRKGSTNKKKKNSVNKE